MRVHIRLHSSVEKMVTISLHLISLQSPLVTEKNSVCSEAEEYLTCLKDEF